MAVSREQIVDALSDMKVMELVELTKELEDKWGVSAAAPAAMVAAAPGAAADAAEEKTEFDVVMSSFGGNKIAVIKVIREITGLGLKEAKELVEGVPATVKAAVSKEDADKIITSLKEAGAEAEAK